MDFTYPVNLKFECNRCGLCCGDTKQKTRHILLLRSEAEKIASQTCQPVTDFSSETGDNGPYVYEMKKSSEGKCVFLKDNRCSIYPLRPLICMFYPFELKFAKNKQSHSFDFTVECPGINQGKVLDKTDFKKLFDAAQERLK
ncbi:MAG: YkgJ family cysteine cluster protein [Candidatus Bathyarchaeia archaeon]